VVTKNVFNELNNYVKTFVICLSNAIDVSKPKNELIKTLFREPRTSFDFFDFFDVHSKNSRVNLRLSLF
jgi:hypothetical protein